MICSFFPFGSLLYVRHPTRAVTFPVKLWVSTIERIMIRLQNTLHNEGLPAARVLNKEQYPRRYFKQPDIDPSCMTASGMRTGAWRHGIPIDTRSPPNAPCSFEETLRFISASQVSFRYDHVASLYARLHVVSYVDSFCWSNTLARMVGSAPSNGEQCRTGVR